MKNKNSSRDPIIIPYDDENMDHVVSGPDYGQPWSSSHAWTEPDSVEYDDFVLEITNKIIHKKVKIL